MPRSEDVASSPRGERSGQDDADTSRDLLQRLEDSLELELAGIIEV
jgi:hypothetical protein